MIRPHCSKAEPHNEAVRIPERVLDLAQFCKSGSSPWICPWILPALFTMRLSVFWSGSQSHGAFLGLWNLEGFTLIKTTPLL